jgi:hypothetical protein
VDSDDCAPSIAGVVIHLRGWVVLATIFASRHIKSAINYLGFNCEPGPVSGHAAVARSGLTFCA